MEFTTEQSAEGFTEENSSLSECAFGSRNFSVSELIMNTAGRGARACPDEILMATLGSSELRLGTVAASYQPARVRGHLSPSITSPRNSSDCVPLLLQLDSVVTGKLESSDT